MSPDDTKMDPDKMAEFTRRDAATRPLEEGDKAGSHDLPDGAPASEMARQHVTARQARRDKPAD